MQQLLSLFFASLFLILPMEPTAIPSNQNEGPKIQLALLLDTSNSMDGLIDQAKSQLWKIVNHLAVTTKDGQVPEIEIAVYAYGNDDFDGTQGYVKQILPLSDDLDIVSDALFKLQTKGGSEYCGEAIYQSLSQLPWSTNSGAMKMIVIAGNEPFTQGPTSPGKAFTLACDKGVAVTSIFCGDWKEGIETGWKDAPACLESDYFNIDQDQAVAHIPTPYDEEILALNQQLNETYLAYGVEGEKRLELQSIQDQNASSFGAANLRERISFKSKSQYKNTSWDLVDAYTEDEAILEETPDAALPTVLQGKTEEEQKEIIANKMAERMEIKAEIKELEEKAATYIAQEHKDRTKEETLDAALMASIEALAKSKGFTFK
jgi:hypothetical protein